MEDGVTVMIPIPILQALKDEGLVIAGLPGDSLTHLCQGRHCTNDSRHRNSSRVYALPTQHPILTHVGVIGTSDEPTDSHLTGRSPYVYHLRQPEGMLSFPWHFVGDRTRIVHLDGDDIPEHRKRKKEQTE